MLLLNFSSFATIRKTPDRVKKIKLSSNIPKLFRLWRYFGHLRSRTRVNSQHISIQNQLFIRYAKSLYAFSLFLWFFEGPKLTK